MAEKKCEEERPDVSAIDVGIGCDDDFVVAEFRNIENISDGSAERYDEIFDLLRGEHFVEASSLNVENFATKRKNCLRATIATHLGRAACRVSFHHKEFALFCAFALAIGQFPR